MKRHLFYPLDFDTRANSLENINPNWEESVRKSHEENQKKLISELRYEFGEMNFEHKLKNLKDAGVVNFSIISYHNALFWQVRHAFILGLYYPSLLASCALGERILNHLIIDLRNQYKNSSRYKQVHGKDSFSDWSRAIDILEEWQVFLTSEVAENYRALAKLRHKSVHFNSGIEESQRADALQALHYMKEIISSQFGYGGLSALAIKGTTGFFFLSTESTQRPFVKTFILPQCPLVGIEFAISFENRAVVFHDRIEYEDREVSDKEFATMFETRSNNVVSSKLPPPDRTSGPRFALVMGELKRVQFDWESHDAEKAKKTS